MATSNARLSPEAICIRPYTPADWPAVCLVHDSARVTELAVGGVDPRAFRKMEKVASSDEFVLSTTAVACVDDRVAGFVSWNADYIAWLYVDPTMHRRGTGRALLDHALRQIGPQAWTNLLAHNTPALRLYLRAGMEVVWTRRVDCEGYPCDGMRVALPTSRMRDPEARRVRPRPSSDQPNPAVRDQPKPPTETEKRWFGVRTVYLFGRKSDFLNFF